MKDYITAILEDNQVIERFHGLPFATQLTIRTHYGKSMQISDPLALSNPLLKKGQTYNFVVAVTDVERVRAFTHSNTNSAQFSGTIRSLTWQPDIEKFWVYNDDYVSKPMSIIGITQGHVLLSRLLLGGVVVGNAVTWGTDHFDLVAIYEPNH